VESGAGLGVSLRSVFDLPEKLSIVVVNATFPYLELVIELRIVMSNQDKVLSFLKTISPEIATNAEIVARTSIQPHQQVFQITRRLCEEGKISSRKHGHEWVFWCDETDLRCEKSIADNASLGTKISYRQFEELARKCMEQRFKCTLSDRQVDGQPKRWDFVSDGSKIIGDAKFYTLVKGGRFPPAKMSVIAEHVWLLEKTRAKTKFLVFGNEKRVPEIWLEKYGQLVVDVDFYFLSEGGQLEKLN
jgi:hypothetical protein